MNEERTEFERQLQAAMQRVDAPVGFADRVMQRADASQVSTARPGAPKLLVMPSRVRPWAAGAVAAVLAVGIFAGEQVHRQREHERATQEFETATRITNQVLEHTREQLQRSGIQLDQ